MIFKFLGSLLVGSIFIYPLIENNKKYVYDINGKPIYYRIEDNDTCYYITKYNDTIKILPAKPRNIEFKGGRDSLRAFINEYYYQSIDTNVIYEELNHMVYISLLLDSSLHIIEPRIVRRTYDAVKYPKLDSTFLSIILKTNNQWHFIENESNKHYFITFSYRIF